MSADDEYRKNEAEITRLTAEIAEKKGYMRGRIDSAKEQMQDDPVLREFIRAREWIKVGADVQQEAGRFVGLPDGWPEGVDCDSLVADLVTNRLQASYDQVDQPSTTNPLPGEETSEFARQFKRGIENG